MARNRENDARQTEDEPGRTAGEIGATMFRLSAQAAEESVQGFSRMFGFGENAAEVFQQSGRGIEAAQNSALILGEACRDTYLEYAHWVQNQMQCNLASVSRIMQTRRPDQLVAAYNQLLGENVALLLTSPACRDREGSSRPYSRKNH